MPICPSGNSISGRRTGCCRVDSVSFVCVFRSFATQPMSPACSRGTSMRSFPCAIERWLSFSAPLRVALYSSSPLLIVPEKTRKKVTSPTCGSDVVLKTCAAHGAVVLGVDLDRRVALGALEGVQLFHLVGVRHQLDDRREHRLRAVVQFARDAEEREELHALHRLLHSGDGLVARDLAALEVVLEQRVVGRRDRLDQLVVVAVELLLRLGAECRSPRIRRSSRRA